MESNVKKTYPWTIQTKVSKAQRKKILNPLRKKEEFLKTIKICPQEMLAHKRKEREKGRTNVPTSSKKDIKRARN